MIISWQITRPLPKNGFVRRKKWWVTSLNYFSRNVFKRKKCFFLSDEITEQTRLPAGQSIFLFCKTVLPICSAKINESIINNRTLKVQTIWPLLSSLPLCLCVSVCLLLWMYACLFICHLVFKKIVQKPLNWFDSSFFFWINICANRVMIVEWTFELCRIVSSGLHANCIGGKKPTHSNRWGVLQCRDKVSRIDFFSSPLIYLILIRFVDFVSSMVEFLLFKLWNMKFSSVLIKLKK